MGEVSFPLRPNAPVRGGHARPHLHGRLVCLQMHRANASERALGAESGGAKDTASEHREFDSKMKSVKTTSDFR